eukprot:TRINITY_DN67357_c0_g1_i1.p1 TRINITY_DN67357_c0_g1~~TRINITY_DN67357_c0_g1_i1.p1  ORF type:complete len:302 (+),score=36.78 TRINITY_DN67357_c0_g1_i1:31-936(+)
MFFFLLRRVTLRAFGRPLLRRPLCTAQPRPSAPKCEGAAAPPSGPVTAPGSATPPPPATPGRGRGTATMALLRLYATKYFWQGIISTAASLSVFGTVWIVYHRKLQTNISQQGAQIVSATLSQPEVVINAQRLSKEIVSQVLNDRQTLDLVVGLLQSLLNQPETRDAAIQLLAHVFATQQARDMTRDFAVDVLAQPPVRSQVNNIVLGTTDNVLHDQATREALSALLREVFAEENFQRATGDALRQALKYSFTPRILQSSSEPRAAPASLPAANAPPDAPAPETADSVYSDPLPIEETPIA